MVAQSFEINATSIQPFDSSSKQLLVELSTESVSFLLIDRQNKKLLAVESFRGGHSKASDWETILQQSRLLLLTELETKVIIGYPNMMPVPASLYAPELASSQLELFYGPANGLFTSGDVLKELEMVIAWQNPLEEHDFLVNHFQWVQTKHAVSILLEAYIQQTDADGQILIYGNAAWLLLWKQGVFQLAKPVVFTSPEDISWYLLDVCRQFELEPTVVHWRVSGMIEEGSSLWQAIIRFVNPVSLLDSDVLLEKIPAHYFAHLIKTL
jgi:hypothetical protein